MCGNDNRHTRFSEHIQSGQEATGKPTIQIGRRLVQQKQAAGAECSTDEADCLFLPGRELVARQTGHG